MSVLVPKSGGPPSGSPIPNSGNASGAGAGSPSTADRVPPDRAREAGSSLAPRMPTDRRRGWITALVLGVLAGAVRLWDLGHPTDDGAPVFDEKHYVPQAWQMLRNGGYEDNAGYELVAHPPVGKQLIAVGEWVFGYGPWGWRVMAALCGVAMVVLIVRIGRRLTRSTLLGALAGILLICDGVSHVQSRMGMLDIFQAVFLLAAFSFLLADRDQMRERLARVCAEGRVAASTWGPRLGFRWWRFACGLSVGLACGVKWNGLYYIAAFGLLSVFWDALARRTAGVRFPWRGALVRDTVPALGSLLVLPLLVYLAVWSSWFASETATDRHATLLDEVGLGFLPDALRSFLYYQGNVLSFHNSLSSSHPWESKPWSWPMGLRPMLYSYESGVPGCSGDDCVETTMLIGTPALWWLALPVTAWALWRVVSRSDWRYGAVLVAYGAGYLPWFANLDRTMYYFYATPLAPFLVLGVVLVLGEVLGASRASVERRKTGLLLVGLYAGLVVANFAWLWPVLNGDPITQQHWQAELWLPSWR